MVGAGRDSLVSLYKGTDPTDEGPVFTSAGPTS